MRTTTVSVSRSSSRPASAASSSGTSATDSRTVPLSPDSISSGAGNQVSRTDPSAASVASPIPEAAVTRPTLPTHYAGIVLDLRGDPIELTAALVDIPSESRHEERIADEVEAALRAQTPRACTRSSATATPCWPAPRWAVPTRVLLAGHLDTVPVAGNLPSRRDGDLLHGCGTTDMKSGDAVFLHLAATVAAPAHDLTLVFYDCEEIESAANGLGRIERELPDWLTADVAILGEPTGGYIEAGCQGTLRVVVQRRPAPARTRRDRGWATTLFTSWVRCWIGSRAIRPAVSRSTAAPTARGCRRCASTAALPATSSPTRRR